MIDVAPKFVSPLHGMYQLADGSPCIDNGCPYSCTEDAYRPPAKGTSLCDIGAYGGSDVSQQAPQIAPPPDPESYLFFKKDSTNLGIIGSDAAISGQNVNNIGLSVFGANNLEFWTDGAKRLSVTGAGKVGIGTDTPSCELDVSGTIRAGEVLINTGGADFVFAPDYRLRPLAELEQFYKEHKHLPDIAPADSMLQNGVYMGELQMKLLQKIEELTLYVIEQQKQIEDLKQELKAIKAKNEE
jgi:hypothetical protein